MAGYIGPAPVPQATQTREVFTLSSTQTTVGTGGYTPGFVDVYLNGAKLAPADFTATNGSDIVLASAAAANDILEVVAFQEFTVVDQTFSGDITFTGANYNVVWDASDNALEFGDEARIKFGADTDFQIYSSGGHVYAQSGSGSNLIITTGTFRLKNQANNEDMIAADQDGAVTLYHNNSAKIATTSSGVDITGTLVSDGLTVSGDAVFTPDNDGVRITGTNYATLRLEENDTTDLNTTIFNSSGAFSLYTSNDARSSLTQRLNIDHSTGDISFYEDTGSTAKLHWSASAESLVIGASSTATVFEATGSKNDQWAGKFTNTNSGGYGVLAITAGSTANEKAFEVRKNTSDTAMLINGVGNVGIGATTVDEMLHLEKSSGTTLVKTEVGANSTVGFEIKKTGSTTSNWRIADGQTVNGKLEIHDVTDSATRMCIDGDGNVGVGTINPTTDVTKFGGSAVGLSVAAGQPAIAVRATGDAQHVGYLGQATTNTFLGAVGGGDLKIQTGTSGLERVRITALGSVQFFEDTGSTAKLSWSPSNERLTLDGSDYQFEIVQGSNQPFFLRALSDGSFRVHLNGTGDAIIVDSSSRVGIGGTPDVPLLIGKTASDHTSAAVTIKNLQTGGYGSILNFESTNNGGAAITAASIGTEGAENYSSTDTTSSHLKFSTVGDGVLTERMRIDAFGRVGIGTSSMSSFYATKFVVNVGDEDGITIYNDGANERAYIMFADATSGTGRYSGQISYDHNNDQMSFTTAANTAVTIDENGRVGIGEAPADAKLDVAAGSGRAATFKTNNSGGVQDVVNIGNLANANYNAIRFWNQGPYTGTVIGSISCTTSATAYNTSSDYRLKENVMYDWDATTRLKQLKPARFNFIADADTTVDGFLAHEVSSIVPEAITGTKDEVDDDGNAVMQGIDQSKLVPLLVKTIQELEARITALEAR